MPGSSAAASAEAEYTEAPASETTIFCGLGLWFPRDGPAKSGPRELFEQLRGELVRLPGGGAVADRHEFDAVPPGQGHERPQRLVPFPGRGVRVDRVRRNYLAGAVHHRDLHPGAQSRVQAQGGAVPGRSCQEHVAQVGGEDPHGLVFRGSEHPAAQVGRQPGQDA